MSRDRVKEFKSGGIAHAKALGQDLAWHLLCWRNGEEACVAGAE